MPELCSELRQFIIETVLENGGHFAANLGVIELTVALHHQLNLPKDQLIWDVGHQAYAHKVLTGRKNQLASIRKTGGMSGFPSPEESEYDAFGTGHSSTSISAILGIAQADKLAGVSRNRIAVIGDGALTAGQAYEALNHAVESNLDILIVVNDNQMSIDDNNGNVARILRDATTAKTWFETMGLEYSYCAEGNSIESVYDVIQDNLAKNGPRVLHIKTTKGYGFKEAEIDGIRWHATESRVKVLPNTPPKSDNPKYQEIAGKALMELALLDEKVVVVTPAMPTGSGLKEFEAKYPNRFFDVGIAEQHAITFSAGLAKEGYRVFCFIYSTFLQRAYDQLIHDVCLQNLPVVFCIDRSGLVGGDGATHHGVFDIAFLKPIPNLEIVAPSSLKQFRNALFTGLKNTKGPFAIRYPRGRGVAEGLADGFKLLQKAEKVSEGKKTAIISVGNCLDDVKKAVSELNLGENSPTIIDLVFIKPLDVNLVQEIVATHSKIVTIENGSIAGGIGEQIAALNKSPNTDFHHLGIPDSFVTHGNTEDLKNQAGFGVEGIKRLLQAIL